MKDLLLHTFARIRLPLLVAALLTSCAGSDIVHQDFGLRLRKDSLQSFAELRSSGDRRADSLFNRYNFVPGSDTRMPRNPSTLRGHIYSLLTLLQPDSCGSDDLTARHFVVFRDTLNFGGGDQTLERIALDHVELVGPQVGLDSNWFEYFNDPLDPNAIREVPRETVFYDPCSDCGCRSLDFAFDCPPGVPCAIECPDRTYQWYMLSLRGGYASYNDEVDINNTTAGKDAFYGSVTAGIRFRGFFDLLNNDTSGRAHWGLGLTFDSGVPLVNSLDAAAESISRPSLMLHFRRQFGRTLCVLPFVYAEAGVAIDAATRDLFSMSLKNSFICNCRETNAELAAIFDSPVVDVAFPFSWGFGIGLDVPLADFMDLSFDIGLRSMAFAETTALFRFDDIPSYRRVSMLLLRAGVTL